MRIYKLTDTELAGVKMIFIVDMRMSVRMRSSSSCG
jgi:hypothetical protein